MGRAIRIVFDFLPETVPCKLVYYEKMQHKHKRIFESNTNLRSIKVKITN